MRNYLTLREIFEMLPEGICGAAQSSTFLADGPTSAPQDCHRLNDFSSNSYELGFLGRSLPSQLRVRSGESVGAQRHVRRGPSLGEATSAGAVNSRATLHALRKRPTEDDGALRRLASTPALASLTPSESNVLKYKSQVKDNSKKIGEELC